jgi:hypothetical protein
MANTADPGLNINFQGLIKNQGGEGEGEFSSQCGSVTHQTKPKFDGCAALVAQGLIPGAIGFNCPEIKGPERGDVLAPWVLVEFGSGGSNAFVPGAGAGGSKITVSNLSSPNTTPQNTAVIQSFEMGASDGITVRVTILDQEGGSFVDFYDNLLKDWNCLKNQAVGVATMKYQFGWVKSGCNQNYPTSYSKCYYATVTGIDTSFSEGKFRAEIQGVDIGKLMQQGHVEEIKGDDGENKMCLMDAIEKLLTNDVAPNVKSVRFLRQAEGGPKPCGFDFKEGKGCFKIVDGVRISKGPKDKFVPSSRNKLETCMKWIGDFSTDGQGDEPKGWIATYDPTILGGEIIFWEDSKPNCTSKADDFFAKKCVGMYTVNGGKNSAVIEFNPKINWNFAQLVVGGGAVGDGAADPWFKDQPGKGAKSPGRTDCPTLTRAAIEGAGHPLAVTNTEVMQNKFGDQGQAERQKAVGRQLKASKVRHDNFTSELVIIGDPTLNPLDVMNKYMTILFINPFHLQIGTGCTDWTARPPCNEVLTSKAYRVKQINHKIELGKYTTHYTVELAAQQTDGSTEAKLGLWVNGWRPQVC